MNIQGYSVLRSKFAREDDAKHFVRSNQDCIVEVLREAGFDNFEAVVDVRLEYLCKPDILCSLKNGVLVIIELCYSLELSHVHKDFAYVLDPAIAEQLGGLIWLCDSVHQKADEMVRYYAKRLQLPGHLSLSVIIPKRNDEKTGFRFNCYNLVRGAEKPVLNRVDESAISSHLQSQARDGEISGPVIAAILGVSNNWISGRACRATGDRPLLHCMCNSDGETLRGPDGRFRYRLEDVVDFVTKYEALVVQKERLSTPIPMICAKDERIKIGELVRLQDLVGQKYMPKNSNTIKAKLAPPAAFCVSSAGLGYSLLYPKSHVIRLLPKNASGSLSD